MLLPDFSRLSLTTPTAAPGAAAPGAAADAVLSNQALISAILFNIRYGNVDSVCEAVVNWCSLSPTNRQACNANENTGLWRDLAERVFPNMRQEVFPPIGSPALGPFIRHFEFIDKNLSETDLPWSGSSLAMSWQAWLFFLCHDYLRKRRRFRQDVAAKKSEREQAKRDARMHVERYENFEDRLQDPRFDGGPPNQRIVSANAKKLEPYRRAVAASQEERQERSQALEDSRRKLLYHQRTYGRTTDHEKYDAQQRRPAYASNQKSGEDADEGGPYEYGSGAEERVYDNFDQEVFANSNTQEEYSNNSEGEDEADENWRERYSDDDDAGVDG